MAKFNQDNQDRRDGRSDSPRSNDERRPFYDTINRERSENRPDRRERSFDGPRRPFGERRDDKPRFDGPRRPFGERRNDEQNDRPRFRRDDDRPRFDGPRRPFGERRDDARPRFDGPRRPFGERRNDEQNDRPRFRRDDGRRDDQPGDRFDRDRREDKPRFDGPRRPFGERRDDKPRFDGPRRPFGERRNDEPAWKDPERKSFRWNDDQNTQRGGDDRRFNRHSDDKPRFDGPRRPFGERRNDDRRDDARRDDARPRFDKPRFERRDDQPGNRFDRDRREDKPRFDGPRRPFGERRNDEQNDRPRFRRDDDRPRFDGPRRPFGGRRDDARPAGPKAPTYDIDRMKERVPARKQRELKREERHNDGTIRLNRYIANSGICSRRDADVLIANGEIKVNGTVVTEMGYKVRPEDTVKYGNRVLNPEKMMYVLLNKPKDYITTTDDPQERHTVMELVKDATPYRIYPVGRLDRNTTGLLLLTNDGELAEKLTHPANNIRKVYQVELDKPITTEHFEQIQEGVELEDGFIKPDDLSIITPDAQVVGIEIHSGRNRIVRRIFEHFGYEVAKLDRTVYAGLTKKDLPRSNWRYLTEKEVIRLKFLL